MSRSDRRGLTTRRKQESNFQRNSRQIGTAADYTTWRPMSLSTGSVRRNYSRSSLCNGASGCLLSSWIFVDQSSRNSPLSSLSRFFPREKSAKRFNRYSSRERKEKNPSNRVPRIIKSRSISTPIDWNCTDFSQLTNSMQSSKLAVEKQLETKKEKKEPKKKQASKQASKQTSKQEQIEKQLGKKRNGLRRG